VKYPIYLSVIALLFSCSFPNPNSGIQTIKNPSVKVKLPDTSKHFAHHKDSLIRSYWNYMHNSLQYSGVALLENNDSFFLWYAGEASDGKKLTVDMPMQIASVSKPFCAAAIMMLMHQNKLHLTDTLRQFFPELPYANITIEALLSHSSGLPEYIFFTDHNWEDKSVEVNNENIIPYMAKNKPKCYFEPGKKHRYTNTNYILLACIVEKISGKKYPIFLKENIFVPLGMNQSRVLEHNEKYSRLPVKGHYGNGITFQPDFQDGTYGEKNIISTVWDLYRFYLGLKNNVLFPKELKEEMFRTRWERTRAGADYALGWRKRIHHGESWIFHTGWWHGFRSNLYINLQSNKFAATLSNRLSGGFIYGNLLTGMFDENVFSSQMGETFQRKNTVLKDNAD